jgi:hypothetical protein
VLWENRFRFFRGPRSSSGGSSNRKAQRLSRPVTR